MQTFTKTGKRDEVADEIEKGDHDAPGDQSQLDLVRAYIASEVRLAATPQHDVYVSVSGHNKDEGIDPERQFRHILIEIRASPDPTATSSALGLDNKQLNVPGLTTETLRAAETIRTNTPNLAEGPDPGTKVVGGPRQETGAAPFASSLTSSSPVLGEKIVTTTPESGISAPELVELATREQKQGQIKTQNMLTDENKTDEQHKEDEQRKEDERKAGETVTTTPSETLTTTPSENLTTAPGNVVTTTPETVTEAQERKL